MLTIYKTTEQGLEQLESMANGTWIKAIDPTPDEIERLVNLGIDVDYINYSLDLDETPRIEREDDFTFILLRIPHRQPDEDIPYTTIPLGIMIRRNTIVTICRHDKEMFQVLTEGKYRMMKTGKRYRFTLYIFLESAVRYLTHLREINRMTEIVEDQLQKSTRNRELLELFKYQKSLTYFATALRANEVMMERVQRMQIFNYYEEDQDLLEDVKRELLDSVSIARAGGVPDETIILDPGIGFGKSVVQNLELINHLDVGTHSLFIGRIVAAEVLSSDPCLTYAHYHEIKGGTTPKTAPSYVAPKKGGK